MADKLKTPKFANETEEAAWWFDHRDGLTEAFEDAAKEGTLKVGSLANLVRKENGVAPTATILTTFPERAH